MFNVIATVIKEQMARIGVTANIRLVDKVTWMTAANQDGPWDMYVEDLLSLLTLDSNAFLSTTQAAWNHTRHTDTKVDDYYARYAREMDPGSAKHREGVPGVQRRQALLEHHLGLAVLHGRAAVDEGLRLQRRVRSALRKGLAGQVTGEPDAHLHSEPAAADHSDGPQDHVRGVRHDAVDSRAIPWWPSSATPIPRRTRSRPAQDYGLDKPILVQYFIWLGKLVQGDWGTSILSGRPVLKDVLVRLPVTLELIVLSMAVALVIAIPAAIIGALRQNTWADYTATSVAMIGVSIPEFFLGVLLLLVFSIGLGGLLPSSGWVYLPGTCHDRGLRRESVGQSPARPDASAGARGGACRAPDAAAAREHAGGHPHRVRHHRARQGAERAAVVLKHALKNALIPTVTVMGLQVGFLIGGAIVVETLFAMPGLGTFGIDAIIARDYQQVQGFALVTALAFVVINLLVDLTYTFLDPRIRYA